MSVNGLRIPWVGGRARRKAVVAVDTAGTPPRVASARTGLMLLTLVASVALPISAVSAYVGVNYAARQVPKDVTTMYRYDQIKETWTKTVLSQDVAAEPDGTTRRGVNTIIIRVDADNPIKQIVFDELLVIGNRADPLFEIVGSGELASSGKINIGTLAFLEVDAGELQITADVVRTVQQNVVAKDNELKLDLHAVNVVRTMRGGASSLFIGKGREDRAFDLEFPNSVDGIGLTRGGSGRETGVRADRVRILGPGTANAFIEQIIVRRTGVMGKIDVRNVNIQDLILRQISLDDSF